MTPKELLARYQPKEGKPLLPAVQLTTARFGRCGKILAAGAFDATVKRWDLSDGAPKELPALTGHNGWVQTIAFHPDGKRLVTADSWGKLCCWAYSDVQPKPLWTVDAAHDGWIRQVAISPDGSVIATCGADRAVRLWTADGKKTAEIPHDDDVFSVAFHTDGKAIVTGDLRGVVRQWGLTGGKAARAFDAQAMFLYDRIQDVGGVRCLAFDPAGKWLACGGGQPKSGGFVQGVPIIQVFDWASGKALHTIKGTNDAEGFVHDLKVHADGFLMGVTSGQPGQGRLFFQRPGDAQPFFVTPKMANCHSLDLHPNGRRIVVAATNGGSSGNGRVKGKGGEYPANYSPLHFWDMPAAA